MNVTESILAYLQLHGPAHTPEIAKALGVPRRTVQYNLARLARLNRHEVQCVETTPTPNGRGSPLKLWRYREPAQISVNKSAPSIFHVGEGLR